ncbi:MAG: hypothetical protein ACFFFC_15875 [Candidatus Thorarchaeota archaeon]
MISGQKRMCVAVIIISAGLAIWTIGNALYFDYYVRVLYPTEPFGEPIWVIAPDFFFWSLTCILGTFLMLLVYDKAISINPRQ